jgi:hypothetical protein
MIGLLRKARADSRFGLNIDLDFASRKEVAILVRMTDEQKATLAAAAVVTRSGRRSRVAAS